MNESELYTSAVCEKTDRPSLGEMANPIRALAMDVVEAANSGHPGMPMGMADVAAVRHTNPLSIWRC